MTSALSFFQPVPCHRHRCFASVCLHVIGLLIVPSIFFREVDRLAFDSSVFLRFYSLKDGCLKSLVFCPKSQYANHCSSLYLGVQQILFFFLFWQVMESLTNLHLHMLRCKRELLFDLVSAETVSPGFACESSLIVVPTQHCFPPGIQAETNSCRGVNRFPLALYNIKAMSEEL